MQQIIKISENTCAIISFSLTICIGLIDFFSGPEYSFSVFYLIPVSLTAWFCSNRLAIASSLFSSMIWFLADQAVGRYFGFASHLWHFTSRFIFLFVISSLLTLQKKMLQREHELSRIDHLTKALNSRAFYEFVELEINRASRYNHLLTMAVDPKIWTMC